MQIFSMLNVVIYKKIVTLQRIVITYSFSIKINAYEQINRLVLKRHINIKKRPLKFLFYKFAKISRTTKSKSTDAHADWRGLLLGYGS